MTRSTTWMLTVLMLALTASDGPGREISPIEDFALAPDRAVPLKQLIPGTEDYYYFHCLHYLNTGEAAKVQPLMKLWIKRYNYTGRVREILNRQALLGYDQDAAASLAYIQKQLNLQFNHRRETLTRKTDLPTALDPKRISRATLRAEANRRYSNLQGFEDRALDWLVGEELNADRRRHLLQRLQRPDYPNLPQLVVADLKHKHSRGFGSFGIHRQLLLEQLEQCIKLDPNLLNNSNLINVYLAKLRPNADVDPLYDRAERRAHLERMWAFVSRLAPAHNSLKAHVLYHRLLFDREEGVYDKQRFMAYLQLPRSIHYVRPEWIRDHQQRRWPVNLGADYRQVTDCVPIRTDEQLVRSYLAHFFLQEQDYRPYLTYIRDTYLKHLFAETMILNGAGDQETWYSMLPPAMYRQLKDRVDIDFAHTNRKFFAADEDVALDVFVKNAKTLLVKVYQVNAANYYRMNGREIDTTITLDGLVANDEQTKKYTEIDLRRVKRPFAFPQLKTPGTYVIDFIGNGKSSRALVRKGRLRYLQRTGPAGHVFTILDERNRKQAKASLWMAGREFIAGDEGQITVPFSTRPARVPVVLASGEQATLDYFQHQPESYALAAGFYVDRESLLKGGKAQVIVRPSLSLNGTPITLSVLENVVLVIHSTDHDGVATTKEVSDFKLSEDKESVYEFQVPDRLRQINFALKAKVQNISLNKKQDLATSDQFALNQVDHSEKVEDLHFAAIGDSYVVDVLGKSGESKASRPVKLVIKHRDFKHTVSQSLQSDAGGRINLGALEDIDWVQATGPENTSHKWTLPRNRHSYRASVHGVAGEPVHLPYMGEAKDVERGAFSLLEVRGNSFVADRFPALAVEAGMLKIDDLPRGDYDLLLKEDGTRIRLRLAAGENREGYVLSENRQLEVQNAQPLQIISVDVGAKALAIRLANASKFSRVHLVATRYLPEYAMYSRLGRAPLPEPYQLKVPKGISAYITGRDIGDEYRYILDRKYARKFAGNMLKRPSELLNPWAIRQTQTAHQQAQAGGHFGRAGGQGSSNFGRGEGKKAAGGESGGFANLDFLPQGSVVVANLAADKDGVIQVDRAALGTNQHVHVVAVDPQNTVYRQVALDQPEANYKDLRLIRGLDPQKHFTEKKQVGVVAKGGAFGIEDITTSRFESYDTLAKVYSLYATLSGNAHLIEFSFILNWPDLKEEQKREKYSKYACHELNFFLYHKDRPFFDKVIRPYLANKKDVTFMDQWLLEGDLSYHRQAWSHQRLNIVERVLLGKRVAVETAPTTRHVADLHDLIPPDIDRFNFLFKTAIKGSALEVGGKFGEQRDKALKQALYDLQTKGGEGQVTGLGALHRFESNMKAPQAGRSDYSSTNGIVDQAQKGARPAPTASPRPPAEQPASIVDEAKDFAEVESESLALGDARRERSNNRALEQLRRKSKESRDADGDDALYFKADGEKRQSIRQFYRKLDATMEWVENNYYKLPIEQQVGNLVTVNGFWRDYAAHQGDGPFLSANLAEASRNFAEMMLALSVLDLPFKAGEHEMKFAEGRMDLSTASPMVVFHKQILPTEVADEATQVLVSQNFFRRDDRYRHENNQRLDKYVTEEFLVHTVYGCQVVITNPTSAAQKLDVLLQIPRGAIAVLNGQATRSLHVALQPYHTQTVEYYFYFPAPGRYLHYPVHVARNQDLIAHTPPFTFNVVKELSKVDTTSWAYLSQHGTEEQVIDYLKKNNINRLDLGLIAWRVQDPAFFDRVIPILNKRHVYHHTLWSYALKHNRLTSLRQFLAHNDAFLNQCGYAIDCKLVTIDPVARHTYQHMEYSPLVNARAHQLSKRRQILNDRFYDQYHRYLKLMTYRRTLGPEDLMDASYYLALQDRVEEALGFFAKVNPQKLATRIQYDYLAAYLDFYNDPPQVARAITQQYKDHPVDRWRKAFGNISAQLDEIEGRGSTVVDQEDRSQQQGKLAATEPGFDFSIESKKVSMHYQNMTQCQVNYYLMDLELLFSRNPFVQQHSGHFAYIQPNFSQVIKLPLDRHEHVFELPQQFARGNVMVEIVAGGLRKSQTYYAHSMLVQVIESYGQVKVARRETGKAIAGAYVKVYAKMTNGQVRFFKDGYTDLRGRFDYGSLNTDEINQVQKFSLLVLSENDGALVKEATPPKQ